MKHLRDDNDGLIAVAGVQVDACLKQVEGEDRLSGTVAVVPARDQALSPATMAALEAAEGVKDRR